MTYITLLEIKNAFLFFLSLSITLSFARMLVTDSDHWSEAYYGAMVGVMAYFAGATAHQGFYWLWRHFGEGKITWITDTRLAFVEATGVLMAIGAACIIRNFTVARFGHKLWLAILVLSAVAALVLSLAVPHTPEAFAGVFSWWL